MAKMFFSAPSQLQLPRRRLQRLAVHRGAEAVGQSRGLCRELQQSGGLGSIGKAVLVEKKWWTCGRVGRMVWNFNDYFLIFFKCYEWKSLGWWNRKLTIFVLPIAAVFDGSVLFCFILSSFIWYFNNCFFPMLAQLPKMIVCFVQVSPVWSKIESQLTNPRWAPP